MNHAKILDCTLRDGAYLVDKTFGDNVIVGIIKGLLEANIDIIEIGFLQDEGFGDGKTVYKNAVQAQKFIPAHTNHTEFSVLADYSRYSISNLEDYKEGFFTSVRACFFKNERYDAIEFFKEIKKKGYKLYIQPVDIMGYDDDELIELLKTINEIEPYCFSIVDTFGSMYLEDLQRIYFLIHHNLISTSKIGFHSHNNLQMSSALSQQFLKMTFGQRYVVVDSTLCGMGRGAGNTPTELIAQYMVSKLNYSYNMDYILDIIDGYMNNIKSKCTWGYTTPYFIAGSYSAHVNNITYLKQKNTIASKDIRYILNKIGLDARKRYDYSLLEQTYLDYLQSDIDDIDALKTLQLELSEKHLIIIAPGHSILGQEETICNYIKEKNAISIMVNFIHNTIPIDYLYFNNINRYQTCLLNEKFLKTKKIIVSNISQKETKDTKIISFNRLIKCGWEHMDNSVILLLRLLDILSPASIGIAGLDGYNYPSNSLNYLNEELELSSPYNNPNLLNNEIFEMLIDYLNSRNNNTPINFVTKSRFEKILKQDNTANVKK